MNIGTVNKQFWLPSTSIAWTWKTHFSKYLPLCFTDETYRFGGNKGSNHFHFRRSFLLEVQNILYLVH